MNWHNKKFVRNLLGAILATVLAAGTWLLYTYYRTENLSDYNMQNSYANAKPVDTADTPDMRVALQKEIDSIKRASGGELERSSDIQVIPSFKQTDSSTPAVAERKENVEIKEKKSNAALQAPSAVFSQDYTIAIGKTVPINIVWEDAHAATTTRRLVTIRVNDIANTKAKFTIEDPFNVLLFSQTPYGTNDKISIADDRHNLVLIVRQVTANAVVINLTSHLNESIVSKLQKIK